MRNQALLFCVFTSIFAGCLLMGCISLPFFGQTAQKTPVPPVDIGFTSGIAGNMSGESPLYSYDEAMANLAQIGFSYGANFPENDIRNITILYIEGNGLDTDANAKNWIFAVRFENTTSLVTYDRRGINRVNWSAGFSGKGIHIDQIISPGKIFDQNREAISRMPQANIPSHDSWYAEGDNYTLILSGQGAPRVLVFDAATGALISSHE